MSVARCTGVGGSFIRHHPRLWAEEGGGGHDSDNARPGTVGSFQVGADGAWHAREAAGASRATGDTTNEGGVRGLAGGESAWGREGG